MFAQGTEAPVWNFASVIRLFPRIASITIIRQFSRVDALHWFLIRTRAAIDHSLLLGTRTYMYHAFDGFDGFEYLWRFNERIRE